jgi:large repetitive protein
VGLKRLSLLVVLAAVLSIVFVPGASAGNFDEGRMGCVGESPGVCPSGTTGQPYSLKFLLMGDEDLGCASFTIPSSGTIPPGLTPLKDTSQSVLSGTPTQAGTYEFYASVDYPGCGKPASDDTFRITINSGLPKLTLGPESTAVGTTGTPYSLQMTASVADAKTWSISSGALPPGLAIDASTGLISGTPTTAGTYAFIVYAKVNADSRSDTKSLSIAVRDPLTASAGEPFADGRAQAEVSVPFDATITATGGFGTYTWSVTTGTVPPGLELVDGTITGTPTSAGSYAFIATVSDAEGRTANVTARIIVAEKLSISTLVLRPGKVGKLYGAKLKTFGGVKPASWRVFRGPLPRGVRFDRVLGTLSGTPKQAGRYRVTFEATDALGVVSKRTLSIVVAPSLKPGR